MNRHLKQKIPALGTAIPGIIRKVYLRCGKPNCRCNNSKTYKHGPYFLWDRKINGRLSSKSIPAEKVKTYKKWINNRKKLEEFVRKLIKEGAKKAQNL